MYVLIVVIVPLEPDDFTCFAIVRLVVSFELQAILRQVHQMITKKTLEHYEVKGAPYVFYWSKESQILNFTSMFCSVAACC